MRVRVSFRGTLAVLLDGVLVSRLKLARSSAETRHITTSGNLSRMYFLPHNGYSPSISLCALFVTFSLCTLGRRPLAQKKAPRHAGENLREAAAAGRMISYDVGIAHCPL